jgi:hypothetical protein
MVDMVYLRNFDLEEKRMEFIGLFGRREDLTTLKNYYLVYTSWEPNELDFKTQWMDWTYMIKQDKKSIMQMPSWCTKYKYDNTPPRYIRQYHLRHMTIAILIGYDKCVMQYLIRRAQLTQPVVSTNVKVMMAKKIFEYDHDFFRAIFQRIPYKISEFKIRDTFVLSALHFSDMSILANNVTLRYLVVFNCDLDGLEKMAQSDEFFKPDGDRLIGGCKLWNFAQIPTDAINIILDQNTMRALIYTRNDMDSDGLTFSTYNFSSVFKD